MHIVIQEHSIADMNILELNHRLNKEQKLVFEAPYELWHGRLTVAPKPTNCFGLRRTRVNGNAYVLTPREFKNLTRKPKWTFKDLIKNLTKLLGLRK